MEEKILEKKNISKVKFIKVLVFILVPVIFTLLMILVLNYTNNIWYYLKPKVIIFTIFLLEIIHVFLTAITGSSKRSVIIQSILLWILELINTLRYTYTYEPLTFADFVYSGNAGEIFSLVKGSILETIWELLPVFSCFAVILTFLIFVTSKFNIKFSYKIKSVNNEDDNILKYNIKTRIILGITAFVILGILFIPSKFVKNIVLTYVYDRYSTNDYEHNSSNIQYYSEDSLLGGMYARLLENRIFEPDNYNKDDMEKILKDFSKTNESKPIWEKSNIIVTFSESFFDVSLLDEDVSFSTNPTPNFNSLKNEGIFVNMISPSYGGVSANVEFEFLTGYSLNYFGKGYTPFMQLYSNDSYRNRPSLIKELNNNDYYTKVVFGKDYFKSEKVYDRLGIDEYEEKDIKSEYKGYYTSDKYLIDKAIEALENKSNNEKLFYMNCTIESHMPFVIDKYKEYDVDVHSDTLTDSQTNVIKSYTQSCYDADKELRKII